MKRLNISSRFYQPCTVGQAGLVPNGRILNFNKVAFAAQRRLQQRSLALPLSRMSPFSLFVLSISFALVVALCGLVFDSGFSPAPEIIASRSGFNLDSWISSFSGSSQQKLKADRQINSQIQYVSDIIRSKFKHKDAHEIAQSIVAESRRAGIDPLFVAAVVKSESSFKRYARSDKGAIGLMQLLPSTGQYISGQNNFAWHGTWKLTEPNYNVKLGVAYIKYLQKMFKGNLEHALIAYNWGPGNLQQALRVRSAPPFSTLKYARTILSNHRKWRDDFTARRVRFEHMNPSAMLS